MINLLIHYQECNNPVFLVNKMEKYPHYVDKVLVRGSAKEIK